MARIPMGNFGQGATTAPVLHTRVQGGDDPVGRAVGDLAQTGMQVADNFQRQQAQQVAEAKEQASTLAKAKAQTAINEFDTDTQFIVDDIRTRVASGKLEYGKAVEQYEELLQGKEQPVFSDLKPDELERYNGAYRQVRMKGLGAINRIVADAQALDANGRYDMNLGILEKQIGLPGVDTTRVIARAEALIPLAEATGADKAAVVAKLQKFKDNAWQNEATSRLLAGKDDAGALRQLETDLTAADGYYSSRLDADRRNILLNSVLSAQSRLDTRMQVEANRLESEASAAMDDYRRQVDSLFPAPVETYAAWQRAVVGTKYEAEFKDLQHEEFEVQKVLGLRPNEQRAYLQSLQTKQRSDGATVPEQQRADRLGKAIESRLTMLRDSPLKFYGATTGEPVQPLDLAMLAAGGGSPGQVIEAMQGQVRQRSVLLDMMRRQYGAEAGNSLLLDEEASTLASVVGKAPPAQALRVYGMLNQVFTNPKEYQAVMQQIAPDSPLRAEAGRIYALQRPQGLPPGPITKASPNGQYGDVALTILTGEALLNPGKAASDAKPVTMPPPQDMKRMITSSLGESFAGRPSELQTAIDAVHAYYASKTADAGDMTGRLNADRLRESVRAVVGEKARFEGRDVVPPWGMSASQFRDVADTYVQARLKAAGLRDPGDVALVNVRNQPGYYALVRGVEPLVDPKNPRFPLIIRIGAPK